MASEYPKELEAPNGQVVAVYSAVEENNLIYGQGFRPKETAKSSGSSKTMKNDTSSKSAETAT